MDVDDEWDLLSDEGLLQISDDGADKQIYSRNSVLLQMDYFICPPPSNQFLETTALPNPRLLPVPIDLPPPVEVKMECCDQDPVTQVFFKKMRETEFVDMKVDSPRPSAAVPPQIESNFEFEEVEKGEIDSEMEMEVEVEGDREARLDLEGGGANVWKWSLNGIGAICSFGVAAAATFCIIVFSTTTGNNKHQHRYGQKVHFRIYSDDKRMKAIAGVSGGVPISRARITVGGYYDESL